MIKLFLLCIALLVAGPVPAASPALAASGAEADYPLRPIRLIVNSSPAGPLDIAARAIAQYVGKLMGQTIIVENRPGASGNVGAKSVAHAAPDGYTLLMTLDTLMTVNPHVFKGPEAAFIPLLEPLGIAGSFGLALAVRADLGIATMEQFLHYAKTNAVTYSSAGYGSPGNLAFEKLKLATGAQVAHVPFRGSAGAVNALLGNQIQAGFLAASALRPHVQAGKMRALAVSAREPDPDLPGVPAMAQLGIESLKDFHASFAFLIMAPQGLPPVIARKWDDSLAAVYVMPDFLRSISSLGLGAPLGGSGEAKQWVATQIENWADVVKSAGIHGQ
ncbi:ABC transporter substrate-binding protein [Achromobacter piechaudii]|uniref:Bug family tripartite tricarboxylate transporter substrate binding protein n=1 Tax=Achromobacter piechaudii TaxID=72556 RepID=UPI00068062DC|nr:tripartite tricarboxylate transporter substrate binding protein [Achromobacter piechaudii]KNY12386.1 ABC transporter substrate-binding protein [Achromobacter piechaudii]